MADTLVEREDPALAIDVAALERYLSGRLPGFAPPLRARKFAGGQSNPTYLLEAGEQRWVLRKKPPGPLLATAHMVDREHRVFSALHGRGVPVPKPFLYCEDRAVVGTEFFVMEHVQGRIFWDPTLPEVASAAERSALYDEMNRVLCALHTLDYAACGLADYGKPGNYFARQIKRWTQQYESAKTDQLPEMDRLIAWLPENVPADDQTTLVHGDFRLDNMIFHPSEPRVLAVLDWELSTLGHPFADVAYNCMPYHVSSRGAPRLDGVAGKDSGIPTQAEYVAQYCQRTGRDGISGFAFYLAFSFFRSASILQGVYHRGLQGNASSREGAKEMRARTIESAQTGVRIIERA
ncbi:MAG TPA: phosphotransferase [Polyangiales bacterium]|nr:phosphotransferase [Polyangiales bacterium]